MNVITDIASQGLTQRAGRAGAHADLCRPAGRRAHAGAAMRAGLRRLHAGRLEGGPDRHPAGRDGRKQGGAPMATVIGHGARLPVLSAALVNGAASHALDFDDVNLAMTGHPSVVLLSALLALAEERGSSGRRCDDRVRRGIRIAMPARSAAGAGALQCARLPCDRHARQLRRRGGVCASAGVGCGAVRHRAGHRGHAGGGAEVDVRHDVQAAACGQGRVSRAARGAAGASAASPARGDVVECAQGFARTHSPDFHPAAALATPPAASTSATTSSSTTPPAT